jgi:hypothetical protein
MQQLAMKLGTKKLQQKLNITKDNIMTEIQLVSPSTTHVEGLRNAIQNECHKGIAAVKAEKVDLYRTDQRLTIYTTTNEQLSSHF